MAKCSPKALVESERDAGSMASVTKVADAIATFNEEEISRVRSLFHLGSKMGDDFDATGQLSRSIFDDVCAPGEAEVNLGGPKRFMADM
jgi:hypothetical protein